MDVKTILKKLDLSYAKLAYLALFNKKGLYEYALDKANTGVNLLLEASADAVSRIREKLYTVSCFCVRYQKYIPLAWQQYANPCNELLLEIYNATADGVVDSNETKAIASKFQIAYSAFKAD